MLDRLTTSPWRAILGVQDLHHNLRQLWQLKRLRKLHRNSRGDKSFRSFDRQVLNGESRHGSSDVSEVEGSVRATKQMYRKEGLRVRQGSFQIEHPSFTVSLHLLVTSYYQTDYLSDSTNDSKIFRETILHDKKSLEEVRSK